MWNYKLDCASVSCLVSNMNLIVNCVVSSHGGRSRGASGLHWELLRAAHPQSGRVHPVLSSLGSHQGPIETRGVLWSGWLRGRRRRHRKQPVVIGILSIEVVLTVQLNLPVFERRIQSCSWRRRRSLTTSTIIGILSLHLKKLGFFSLCLNMQQNGLNKRLWI